MMASQSRIAGESLLERYLVIARTCRGADISWPLGVIKEDPADDRILECAVASQSDYLVGGDKRLLNLGKVGPIPIIKVADFLELFERQQGQNRS